MDQRYNGCMTDENGRTALYRPYDADDNFLYVGITVNPVGEWVGPRASDIQRSGRNEGEQKVAVDRQALGATEVVLVVGAEPVGEGEHHVVDGFSLLAV